MFGWGRVDCRAARGELVAWIDGALPAGRAQRVAAHVEQCAACSAAAADLRAVSQVVTHALRTPVGDVNVDALWRGLQPKLMHGAPGHARVRRRWMWRTAWAVAAAAGVAVWVGSNVLGGPETVLITTGVKSPPKRLKEQPDLFKDYAIIEDLDVLERFDTADTEAPLDAITPAADQG